MKPDLLFLAWNRLEFTEASFESILANTDWDRIRDLVVVDDGSGDGTDAYLREAIQRAPVTARYDIARQRSPVGSMNRYLAGNPADWFVKLDNDVCVPPGWLDPLLTLAETIPDLDLLGMEAGMTGRPDDPDWDGVYRFEPSSHIGGIGLMRTQAFKKGKMYARGRFGFTEYQWEAELVRGWITPDLPIVLLDRMPCDPWLSLSDRYVKSGWQRDWPKWDPVWMKWAFDWMGDTGCSSD